MSTLRLPPGPLVLNRLDTRDIGVSADDKMKENAEEKM
jgi:hypothetical protein